MAEFNMTTWEEDFIKEFNTELERVKAIYKYEGRPETRELIEQAEHALKEDESLDIYLAMIKLKDEI